VSILPALLILSGPQQAAIERTNVAFNCEFPEIEEYGAQAIAQCLPQRLRRTEEEGANQFS
jgi:hypothetical protein